MRMGGPATRQARRNTPAIPSITVLVVAALQQQAAAPHAEVAVNTRGSPEPPSIPRVCPSVMTAHAHRLQVPAHGGYRLTRKTPLTRR